MSKTPPPRSPRPDDPAPDQRRGIFFRAIKITGIKNLFGAIIGTLSIDFGSGALLTAAAIAIGVGIVVAGVALAAAFIDPFDADRAQAALAIVTVDERGDVIGATIVHEASSGNIFVDILQQLEAHRDERPAPIDYAIVQAMIDQAKAEILAAYVPPGPPGGLTPQQAAQLDCIVRATQGAADPCTPAR